MDINDAYQAAFSMRDQGGSFVKALALAWFVADDDNREKLQTTFPEYFTRYLAINKEYSRSNG